MGLDEAQRLRDPENEPSEAKHGAHEALGRPAFEGSRPWRSRWAAWHKEKCNVCFFDGQAEFVEQSFIKSTKKADLFWKGLE
jgi:prepilin-type processing-associated H-X9-DG protein